MFLEMKQFEDELNEIDTKARKLKYTTKTAQSEPMDALKLIKASMKAFQPKNDREGHRKQSQGGPVTRRQTGHR